MSNYSAAIEWTSEDREYSFEWRGYNGESLLLPPIGTIVVFDGRGIYTRLKVLEIICFYTLPKFSKGAKQAIFYIKCETI